MSQRPPNSPLTPASARARSAPSPASGWTVDSARLWRGAVPAALVGALVAVVGLLVIRDLLGVPVLRRTDSKDLIQASTLWYIVAAAVAAVVATGLLHLLLRYTPRPFAFYGWLTGLAIAIVTLLPLTFPASTETRVATAVLNLVIGVVVATLVAGVGRTVASPPARRVNISG